MKLDRNKVLLAAEKAGVFVSKFCSRIRNYKLQKKLSNKILIKKAPRCGGAF